MNVIGIGFAIIAGLIVAFLLVQWYDSNQAQQSQQAHQGKAKVVRIALNNDGSSNPIISGPITTQASHPVFQATVPAAWPSAANIGATDSFPVGLEYTTDTASAGTQMNTLDGEFGTLPNTEIQQEAENVRAGMRPSFLAPLSGNYSDNYRAGPTLQGMRLYEAASRALSQQDSGLNKAIARTVGPWGGIFPQAETRQANPNNNGLLPFNRSPIFSSPDSYASLNVSLPNQGVSSGPQVANVLFEEDF